MSESDQKANPEASNPEALIALRDQIDALDTEVLGLLNQRAGLAMEVARVKKDDDPAAIFYRPEREAQVLRRIKEKNTGPMPDDAAAKLFREIMSVCLSLEDPQRVAFLGPIGTFTEAAALKHFGKAALTTALPTISDVFREVEAGSATYGVVPVENSSEGVVNHTLDRFMSSSLSIIGEVELRIHHHFLVGQSTKVDAISKVYSHQQSLAQCRHWLDTHYPAAERVAVSSNAEAARRVGSEWHSAAIAGSSAAQNYELTALYSNIEDNPENTTRFLIVGASPVAASGKDKTSIVVSAADKAGALLDILKPLAARGISLTSIETRPAKPDKWAYVFFIDLLGHASDPHICEALDEIRSNTKNVRVLGSYPRAVI